MDALARPWLLARLLSGLVTVALCLAALFVAWRVLRHWRVGATSEGQLALERRAELVATQVQAGLFLSLTSLVLTVLAADRSADAIRGAMCAWGVFDSTAVGLWPLATSAAAALACALWLVLHRLDLRLEEPRLTRTKFLALNVVAPLVVLDLGVFAAFASQLDFDVVASCCSVGLDGFAGRGAQGAGAGPGATFFALSLGLCAVAIAVLCWSARRPSRASGLLAALASVAATTTTLPAVLLYVAPHAYELPHHRCPFCLLHAGANGIGWPLFGGLFLATTLGLGLGLVELLRPRANDPGAVDESARALGRWGALGWAVVVVCVALPVATYWARTGASVFG
ncbi:MAG: hypothetical protein KF901_07720 [Myxococcales bacterium]|nr:hypothetical protein [Myxococcales bacterium]